MKTLSKGDEANISAFKALINMVQNDIKEVKESNLSREEKLDRIWEHNSQLVRLVTNANKAYPHINFISECIGQKTAFDESLITTARMKVLDKYNLN